MEPSVEAAEAAPHRSLWPLRLVVGLLVLFLMSGLVLPLLYTSVPESELSRSASILAASRNGFTVTRPVELMSQPRVTIERGTISFAPGRRFGPLTGAAAASWLASGQAQLLLADATVVVEFDADDARADEGPTSAAAAPPLAPLLDALQRISFDTLTVRRGNLVVRSRNGTDRVFNNISANLDMQPRSNRIEARGEFDFRGEDLRFKASLGTSPPQFGTPVVPLDATIRGPSVTFSMTGGQLLAVSNDVRLTSDNAQLAVPDLRKLARWLGVMWPAGPGLKGFETAGRLDWTMAGVAFEKSRMQLDGNELRGSMMLVPGRERPFVEATLAADTLDLTPYERSATPSGPAAKPEPAPKPSDLPSIVRQIDLDLRISADEVLSKALRAKRLAATLVLTDGQLLAQIADVAFDDDVTGVGQIAADLGSGQPYAVRGRLANVNAARFTKAILGSELVSGVMAVSADVVTAGDPADFLAGLNGRMTLSLPQGGRIAGDLSQLAAAAVDQQAGKPGWGRIARGDLAVQSLEARLSAAGRNWTIESIKVQAGDVALRGSGMLDAGAGTADVEVSSSRPAEDPTKPSDTSLIHILGGWQAPAIIDLKQQRRRPPQGGGPRS